MAKKHTLRDVAREAGVSQATASLVLNGKNGISEVTKQKVMEVVERLDYKRSTPNIQTDDIVGIVIDTLTTESDSHTFSGIIISSILHELALHPVKIELLSTAALHENEDDEDTRERFAQKMANWKGAIFLHSMKKPVSSILSRFPFPIIIIDSSNAYPQYYQVDNDNLGGAYKGVKHLIELKHNKIAYMGSRIQDLFGYLTFSGYKQAMTDFKLPLYGHLISEIDSSEPFSVQQGYTAMKNMMDQADQNIPTAVFCSSDELAYGVLQYIQQTNLRIAVVAMDDMPHSAFTQPPLTTVRIRIPELGIQAAKMFISLLKGNYSGPRHIVLDNELVIRESSFPAES